MTEDNMNEDIYGMQGIPPFPWYWEEWKPQQPLVRKVPQYSLVSDVVDGDPFSPTPSPLSPKHSKHRPKEMSFDKVFDPYQVFEVEHKPCLILTVRVLCGRNITKGWMDILDTPDPYIVLRIRTAPEGRRRTAAIDNEVNPVWAEEFTYLLDENEHNEIQIALMEANPGQFDQKIGDVWFDLTEIPKGKLVQKTFIFNDVSEVDMEFETHIDQDPTLRYSLCLCDEEKEFIMRRKERVRERMAEILGDKGPMSIDEVPLIGVIGSGGGFRAMVGYSGVAKALADSGIMDCATYMAGLSGSSWYISTLYSHKNWPEMNPGDMQEELKNNIDSSLMWFLSPQSIYRNLDLILQKRKNGQPISFTDIFGHLVGETLIKDRLDFKLTDMKEKISDGQRPLPLMTCVNVKMDRSARSFQEWVEFSPFEIGMPKYGTFMKTEMFGCKFFMGKLCKQFPEPPLHFLQGIWGSAFCILFKRLLDDNRKLDPVEMIRQEMVKQIEVNQEDESSDSSEDDEEDDTPDEVKLRRDAATRNRFSFSDEAQKRLAMQNGNGPKPKINRKQTVRRTKQKTYWQSFLTGILDKKVEVLNTRAGRAGVVHNFMRGLSLQQTFPLSPFTPSDNIGEARVSDDFSGLLEMHPTNVKHLYMVDAGLTFNSPYPLVLRPQRCCNIILSFDFSARPGDSTRPFKELLLAEKWAKLNKLSFPPIDSTVFDREGMKELYIFRHPTDPYCPVVLHFVLVNIEFRKFLSPGVPRVTEEELEFANFDIFDDAATPYSTFNFKYSHDAFMKLSKLTEFNTLLHIEDIKTVIAEQVQKKRENPTRLPCSLKEVNNLRRVSVKNRQRLSRYLSQLGTRRSRVTSAGEVLSSSGGSPSSPNQHMNLAKSESEAGFRRNVPERKPMVKSKRKLANTRRSEFAGLGELSSPLEDDEYDGKPKDATLRSRPGRLAKTNTKMEGEEQWEDATCDSIDEDSDDDQFFSVRSEPL
ncbi:cytosolic phospholipase A2-like isoform X3 [Pecten maximus]|uniref:cytosolic phospholipase A2-like isoform X3 n=1 Tax=Pecten maximus TaxID=6579 RepID=UPI001458027D|nr:cytosolic phospholipase A2-like isoform X3 [Pecten maximus]